MKIHAVLQAIEVIIFNKSIQWYSFLSYKTDFEQSDGFHKPSIEIPTDLNRTETADSTNEQHNPKYLEMLCDENGDEPISCPYEIPFPDISEQNSLSSSKNAIAQDEDKSSLKDDTVFFHKIWPRFLRQVFSRKEYT